MIRKKRMSKGIAKILSGLLVFGMVAGLVPAIPGGTVHAKAADVSEPGVTVYATKEQLMTAFTTDESGTNTNVGKLLFGKNASGNAQDWYILGKDNGVQGDNTIIFAASPMATGIEFSEDDNEKAYQKSYGSYTESNLQNVYSNHYGASKLRNELQKMTIGTGYFSDSEKALMQETKITTKDSKNKTTYTNSDKLYVLNSDYCDNGYVLVGSADKKISRKKYCSSENAIWLRAPYEYDNYPSPHYVIAAVQSEDPAVIGYHVINKENKEVRPAANLDLSNVLFASAVTHNSSGTTQYEGMILRLDGKDRNIGTVTYDAKTQKVNVNRGTTQDDVYIIIQYKTDDVEGCFIEKIDKNIEFDGTYFGIADLSKCKIWLETIASDGMIYAVKETGDTAQNPEPNPEPKPEPTPTPAPNPTPEASTPTPDPAPATSTPAALTTTTPAAAAPAQVTYDILDGAGSSWTQNTDGSLAIRGSGEISKFREVKVDGVTVDPVNYTVTEGSTIITFKPEYLKSLSAGNHSFELVWTDGTAATNFTVAENADQSAKSPKTGEDFSRTLCTVLLMVSCAGLAGMFVRRKKSSLR